MALALDFKPDLILEVGRGAGHSTCALTQASHLLSPEGECEVVSLCPSAIWNEEVEPRLRNFLPASWFGPLAVHQASPSDFDFSQVLSNRRRILVYWSDQSVEAAVCLLGKVLPTIADHPHLIAVHNLFDIRHMPRESYGYGENVWWKTGQLTQDMAYFGRYCGKASLVAPISDFLSRNGIEAYSADHSFALGFSNDQINEMLRLFGDNEFSLFKPYGCWSYFSLNNGSEPFILPI
jgi:hypothetical protein